MLAGAKYLDDGKLYVAQFSATGQGQWIELNYENPSIKDYGDYDFADQADVLIHARLAGDALGATQMDRPEWAAVNPINREVYLNLTNNSSRTASNTNAANPRSYTTNGKNGNVNGHIIRWKESGAQSALNFTWDIYLFGARSTDPALVNLSGLSDANDFSSPDGLYFDPKGVLWIQTDDGAYTDTTNCMMLAALPGKVGDGQVAAAVSDGISVRTGQQASADTVRRFLIGPVGCEITGVVLTPDRKTLFCNVQHPGENGSLSKPTSHWPDSQNITGSTKRPRSATFVVTRADGGEIAIDPINV
jgi:secreted PhoX family phosphatase